MGCFFQLQLQSQAELMAPSFLYFSWCLCSSEVEMINEPFIFLHFCPKCQGPICQGKFHNTQKGDLRHLLKGPPWECLAAFTSHSNTSQWNWAHWTLTREPSSPSGVSASSPQCSTKWLFLGTPCLNSSCWSEFSWSFWGKWHGSDL